MEKKTIGGFIAALRKANGMTQRELAEKLNVSDKAISRWERDECAPDLTLIPVLADIFGVTTDEILRGARKAEEENPVYQKEKSKKQMKNLFEKAFLRFKDKSWISVGVAILGYLLVLLFNFAVLRGDIGFFVALVFYAGAVITQICFTQHALALHDEDFDETMQTDYKINVVILTRNVYFVIFELFAVTLPFSVTGRAGFVFFSWLGITLVCAILAFAVWSIGYMLFVKPYLVKKSYIICEEKAKQKMLAQNRLLKRTLAISLAVAVVLFAPMLILQESMIAFAKKEVFYDYESFGEYMARKEPAWHYEEFPENENDFRVRDDYILNSNDEIVYTYEKWNQNVWLVEYEADDDGLPISVITDDAYNEAANIVGCICAGLCLAIVIDFMTALIIFLKKFKKISKEFS